MPKIFAKIRDKLGEKKGVAYIDAVIMILCTTMILVFTISVGGTIYRKIQIDAAAVEVKRMVEIDGVYNSIEKTKAQSLLTKSSVTAIVSCDANGQIPLNSEFTITLTGSSFVGVGNIGGFSIPLYGTSVGHSEAYWKD